MLQWEPGFDGGYPQWFIISYASSMHENRIQVEPDETTQYNVTGNLFYFLINFIFDPIRFSFNWYIVSIVSFCNSCDKVSRPHFLLNYMYIIKQILVILFQITNC